MTSPLATPAVARRLPLCIVRRPVLSVYWTFVGHSEVETPPGVKFSTYGLPVTWK